MDPGSVTVFLVWFSSLKFISLIYGRSAAIWMRQPLDFWEMHWETSDVVLCMVNLVTSIQIRLQNTTRYNILAISIHFDHRGSMLISSMLCSYKIPCSVRILCECKYLPATPVHHHQIVSHIYAHILANKIQNDNGYLRELRLIRRCMSRPDLYNVIFTPM